MHPDITVVLYDQQLVVAQYEVAPHKRPYRSQK